MKRPCQRVGQEGKRTAGQEIAANPTCPFALLTFYPAFLDFQHPQEDD
jgi:hypothetical protein